MLDDFQQTLATDKSLNPKHAPHYIRWIRDCYSFFSPAANRTTVPSANPPLSVTPGKSPGKLASQASGAGPQAFLIFS